MIGLRGGEGLAQGAYEDLRTAHELLTTGGRTWYLGRVLASLGAAERRRGELEAARAHLAAGFAELAAYGARVDAVEALEELGRVEHGLRDAARAATLLGAASALRDSLGLARADAGSWRASVVGGLREALGPIRFDRAWQFGRGASLADAGRLATETLQLDRPRPPRDAQLPAGHQLTPREREVAALVADGLTNPQIAERLFISPGTVRTHVERILGKLGLTSRVQVARWFAEATRG
jgi:non-specific serine/threonine protein kinase